jgi:hypothetical protein
MTISIPKMIERTLKLREGCTRIPAEFEKPQRERGVEMGAPQGNSHNFRVLSVISGIEMFRAAIRNRDTTFLLEARSLRTEFLRANEPSESGYGLDVHVHWDGSRARRSRWVDSRFPPRPCKATQSTMVRRDAQFFTVLIALEEYQHSSPLTWYP